MARGSSHGCDTGDAILYGRQERTAVIETIAQVIGGHDIEAYAETPYHRQMQMILEQEQALAGWFPVERMVEGVYRASHRFVQNLAMDQRLLIIDKLDIPTDTVFAVWHALPDDAEPTREVIDSSSITDAGYEIFGEDLTIRYHTKGDWLTCAGRTVEPLFAD